MPRWIRFLNDTLEKDESTKNKTMTCVANCECVVKLVSNRKLKNICAHVIILRRTVQWRQIIKISGSHAPFSSSFQKAGIQSRKSLATSHFLFRLFLMINLRTRRRSYHSSCMNLHRIRSLSAKWIRAPTNSFWGTFYISNPTNSKTINLKEGGGLQSPSGSYAGIYMSYQTPVLTAQITKCTNTRRKCSITIQKASKSGF
jgi:hypothetical protein